LYLGVHWPSDVLCGWAVATLWLTTLVLIGWARPRIATVWASCRVTERVRTSAVTLHHGEEP